jgi:hypothetical protein
MPDKPIILMETPLKQEITDFSDRLSPMLVKELRQGLRSKYFVGIYLLLHAALVFTTLPALIQGQDADFLILFWVCAGAAICVLLPLSGFNAVHSERRENTLDTLVLTNLTSWRIVAGKWASIAARILLLSVTLLPYIVLRYFGGGVDLILELTLLAAISLGGLFFAALIVAFSAIKEWILRGISVCALGAAVCIIGEDAGDRLAGIYIFSKGQDLPPLLDFYGLGWLLISAVFIACYAMDVGADKIAPATENRSYRRRILSFCYMALSVAFFLCMEWHQIGGALFRKDYVWVYLVSVAAWISVDALLEQVPDPALLNSDGEKKGFGWRLLRGVANPGWSTGVWFAAILIGLPLLARLGGEFVKIDEDDHAVAMIIVAQMLFGVVFVRIFARKAGLVGFWIVQIFFGGMTALLTMISKSADSEELILLLGKVPVSWISYAKGTGSAMGGSELVLKATAVAAVAYLTLLFIIRRLRRWAYNKSDEAAAA